MATSKVVGLSPVTFASEDTGVEIQIPLSSLTIDSTTGAIDASGWISATAAKANDQALLGVLIPDLQKRGVIAVSTS